MRPRFTHLLRTHLLTFHQKQCACQPFLHLTLVFNGIALQVRTENLPRRNRASSIHTAGGVITYDYFYL